VERTDPCRLRREVREVVRDQHIDGGCYRGSHVRTVVRIVAGHFVDQMPVTGVLVSQLANDSRIAATTGTDRNPSDRGRNS
jgi:acyl-CoA hydrolase